MAVSARVANCGLILCKRQEEVRVGRVNDFNVCLLSPQRPKSRSLHHYSEESWLLAAVWWWHCGGAWLLVLAYLFNVPWLLCLHCHLTSSYLCCAENWCPGHWGVLRSYLRYLEELWVGIHPLLPIQGVMLEKDRKDFICFVFLTFSLTDSSSPSHPAPSPQVRPLWSMCQSSAPVSPSGFYLVCFFSLSLSLFWFLSFSHLHLDCTLIWKAKMLNSMIGEEKALHQAATWCSQPGRIWYTYR